MVMDATPSPQHVGREFVRQYYTVLNKAPDLLHRFYINHSSFIHGGLETHNREATLAIGQKNIHSKIQQLNFRDCHAKISQVDAQVTLGNGVVVQVTGELSNDGQPMRRFTQTFVLGAQSPKNYYVHNDIFRYQDLYIEEDVESGETRSENDDEQHEIGSAIDSTKILLNNNTAAASAVVAAVVSAPNTVSSPEQQQTMVASAPAGTPGTAAPQQIYYAVPLAQAAVAPFNAAGVASVAAAPTGQVTATVPGQLITVQPQQQTTAGQVNGVHDELLQTIQQSAAAQIAPAVPAAAVLAGSGVLPTVQQASTGTTVLLSQQNTNIVPTVPPSVVAASVTSTQSASMSQQQNQIIQNSTGPTIPSTTSTVSAQQQTNLSALQEDKKQVDKRETSPIEAESNKKDENKINEQTEKYDVMKSSLNQNEVKTYANLFKSGNFNNTGFVPLPQPSHQINSQIYSKSTEPTRTEINSAQTPGLPQRTNASRQTKDYSERRTSNVNSFGDSHQLFFGNVPHCATEDDLKALFSKYGTVVELRIHSKQGSKIPGQRHTQNYGFITYENLEDVQTCLANCPLYYPAENGQKLNVEEKKTRPRSDIPNRPQNNMSNSGGGLGGSQRPAGGGGQPNRSHSNTGGLMRSGNSGQRTSGGSGGFNRNDNRGPPQNRNTSGNINQNTSSGSGGGGGSYARR
ncbi:ras GTPase-activating protein-binding protein 1 [Condylostylus longicornis]|uniref:ras GTPase-activating protein-binding protein 1 n=1 Tax=Condylostylus longicornis TaxID=2530218 RepID=UPI00244DBADD|nr:ras GTPase-activating protein-binding protein 1 [Condylostylus longicornis]XP_055384818.1 ras GTPase-activating protein-binding protein 1 [Condylostylus longicornis]